MAKDTSQKLKMTRILDMLRIDSSKEEPLTTDVLCSRLMNEFQIVCDVSLGGKMKIVSPEALDQRYKEWIRKSIGEEGE